MGLMPHLNSVLSVMDYSVALTVEQIRERLISKSIEITEKDIAEHLDVLYINRLVKPAICFDKLVASPDAPQVPMFYPTREATHQCQRCDETYYAISKCVCPHCGGAVLDDDES